jgi:hypothetical protein
MQRDNQWTRLGQVTQSRIICAPSSSTYRLGQLHQIRIEQELDDIIAAGNLR